MMACAACHVVVMTILQFDGLQTHQNIRSQHHCELCKHLHACKPVHMPYNQSANTWRAVAMTVTTHHSYIRNHSQINGKSLQATLQNKIQLACMRSIIQDWSRQYTRLCYLLCKSGFIWTLVSLTICDGSNQKWPYYCQCQWSCVPSVGSRWRLRLLAT